MTTTIHETALNTTTTQINKIVDTWFEYRQSVAHGACWGRRQANEKTAELLGHTIPQVEAVMAVYWVAFSEAREQRAQAQAETV